MTNCTIMVKSSNQTKNKKERTGKLMCLSVLSARESKLMKRLITYIFVLGITITACESKDIDFSNNEIAEDSNNIKSIDLDTKDNVFSKAISEDLAEGCNRASFIVDLDVDGNNEAFVVEGYEDDPGIPDYDDSLKYWYVNRIYFVDEECNTTLLEDFEDSYIATSQDLLERNSQSFISINGYIGVDGIGCVYSVSEDCIKNCTPKLNKYGQKKFISDTEIVWYEEAYRSFFDYEEGSALSDLNGSGRCKLPYHMYLRDGEFYLYDAKEVTIDEVKEKAPIDIPEEIDISTAQFILRDNNELDINYYEKDKFGYEFHCAIYFLSEDKSAWYLKETIPGYMDVNLNENNWSVLNEDSAAADVDADGGNCEDKLPYQQLVESLGICKYEYPSEFNIDRNLESLLENMTIYYSNYSSEDDFSMDVEKSFIRNFCQNSWFCYDYIFDSLSTSDGLINKQQIEYIQYSFSGQYREFQSISDDYVVDVNDCSSGFVYAELQSYEVVSDGEEIVLKANFNISDNSSKEAVITLIKNEYSCFDGYSVKTFQVS